MRVARAFRWSILFAVGAGALGAAVSGALAQGRNDLDYMTYGQPAARPASDSGGAFAALRRALSGVSAPSYAAPPPAYAAQPVYPSRRAYSPPVIMQAPAAPTTVYDAYAAAPSTPVRYDSGYRLDAGDKLRVVVYGQDGLTNSYAIDAGGAITMPLIGSVPARVRTPSGLAAEIAAKLRKGYIREPSVAVEIESYRPFFILGEVQAPGQYPYVPNMTVESAVAIAGGFSPRAKRDEVTLTHTDAGGVARYEVPLGTSMGPGDTIYVRERWF